MSTAATERDRARFRQVLKYIDAHLDEDLAVERLSRVAALSKYHFHRQFTVRFGIGVARYVQLSRLKRASYQLAFRALSPIIALACASGYEGPEAFARAFKKTTGQSPSAFRQAPQWEAWHAAYQPLNTVRIYHMTPAYRADQVRIVDFPETRVAVLAHRGDPKHIGASIRQFIEWRRHNHLSPAVSATFNIVYDDPEDTDPDAYRLDLCAAVDHPVAPNPFGVVAKTLPAGRCAVLRHIGSDAHLRDTVTYLYADWLPGSGETLREFPLYFQRVRLFPDVPECEAVTDVFLPLE